MSWSRRAFLAAVSAALVPELQAREKSSKLGIASPSYAIRSRIQGRAFRDPLLFVTYCHERGAGGAQLSLGNRDADYIKKLRAYVEKHGLYLEGSIRVPRDKDDVARFDAEVRTAKACGVTVLRTVMLNGRRYETFAKAEDFQRFQKQSKVSLELAAPVVAKHRLKLAVENHKDQRCDEMIALLRHINSEHVGVCIDTGNNLALLEDPLETVKALSPWAMACHLKDMAVEEYPEGFLLSGVPLGTGLLDLKSIVSTLKKANSALRFSLEMITRDPLRIPCLTEKYWATMSQVPGRDLAKMLSWVRTHPPKKPLPRITKLTRDQQLAVEEKNVRDSLRYANETLSMGTR